MADRGGALAIMSAALAEANGAAFTAAASGRAAMPAKLPRNERLDICMAMRRLHLRSQR
jgi:hypothetical protein